MKNLHEQFQANIHTLYSAKEMSEILIAMYTSIELSLKLDADTIKVTTNQIIYMDENGNIIYDTGSYNGQLISNIDVLDLILSRDGVAKDHLELVARDVNEVVYKITQAY